ncbi:hypothetical protein EAF04_001584 [Stromatinia cepivora]|nr:hypothetical protein EAF04_001584 [Stromatinia cepivora]
MASPPLKVELRYAIENTTGGFKRMSIKKVSGGHIEISFHRTIRVPDDCNTHQLPPDLGNFPIFSIDEHAEKLPVDLVRKGGVFIPIFQREALWIRFFTDNLTPFAIKVYVGGINAVSGQSKHDPVGSNEADKHTMGKQNYLVVPGQEWLDGVVRSDGTVMQFVAGMIVHLILRLRGGGNNPIPPKMAKQMEEKAEKQLYEKLYELTLAPGGSIHQAIRKDHFGKHRYDEKHAVMFNMQLLGPKTFQLVTGLPPPQTPVSAETYAEYGYPFFEMYNEPRALTGTFGELLKSVGDIDKEKNVNLEVHQREKGLHFRTVKLNTVDEISDFYPDLVICKKNAKQ